MTEAAMTGAARPLARASALAEVVREDSCVVFNLGRLEEQQSPYVFDGTSFAVWSLIDGTRTLGEIVAELASIYAVDPGAIEHDVNAFVASIATLGLIEQ